MIPIGLIKGHDSNDGEFINYWFQLIYSKSSRNDWLLNFSQSWDIMLYSVGGKFEKNSGSIKNCGRWFDILDEMFPDIALFTSGFDILQKYYQLEFYCY